MIGCLGQKFCPLQVAAHGIEQRVAVRVRVRNIFGGNLTAGAGAVFDDGWLAERPSCSQSANKRAVKSTPAPGG